MTNEAMTTIIFSTGNIAIFFIIIFFGLLIFIYFLTLGLKDKR